MALAVVAIVVEMESGMSGSSSASGSSFRYGPVVTTVTMTVLGFSILAFRCLSCFHCSRYDGDSVPVKRKETDATAACTVRSVRATTEPSTRSPPCCRDELTKKGSKDESCGDVSVQVSLAVEGLRKLRRSLFSLSN